MNATITELASIHLVAVWAGILAGILSGAVMGLFFAREDWLGGYDSWPRRMLRLGHISFFGLAALNLIFAVSVFIAGGAFHPAASWGLLAGALLMPGVCFLAAWRKPLRHLFPLPVVAIFTGALATLIGILRSGSFIELVASH